MSDYRGSTVCMYVTLAGVSVSVYQCLGRVLCRNYRAMEVPVSCEFTTVKLV